LGRILVASHFAGRLKIAGEGEERASHEILEGGRDTNWCHPAMGGACRGDVQSPRREQPPIEERASALTVEAAAAPYLRRIEN
jgi:hypothetical protein